MVKRPDPETDPSQQNDSLDEVRPSILGDLLGEGLRVAFGTTDDPPDGRIRRESVLAWLRRTLVEEPRDTPSEWADSGARDEQPTTIGPYTLCGEIARGGIGVIYKVRERNLGRDLALKVLQGQHEENTHLLLRFIEEAQIASQLQHPGIVPIHELGEHNGLPYFTMKLVRGRTLADLLDEREQPTEGRASFLAIFEKVADTLAYAHSRGVIHRDLKPANIMAGSFGEVQVMDWGLAKVLDESAPDEMAALTSQESSPSGDDDERVQTVRSATTAAASDSLAGSVLGTPAYMAPEQARGEVDLVNERADVFGLGALLCEILTGSPPFEGADVAEIHEAAKRGDIARAVQRLEESALDTDLRTLAVHCLAPNPADRPTDAGIVAKQLHDYLASLEARARAAELEAAAATVRVAEAHKRRRLVSISALCLVLAVVVGAGSYLYLTEQEREHRESVASDVRDTLQKARNLYAQSRGGERSQWESAIAMARDAEQRAGDHGDFALLEEARALTQEIVEEAAHQARMHAMIDRLEQTEVEGGFGAEEHQQRLKEEYYSAFREFGIDIEGLSIEAAAAKIRDQGIAEAMITALDSWASTFVRFGKTDDNRWQRLLQIAQRADDDRGRCSLRQLVLDRDRAEIERVVAKPEGLPDAVSSILLLVAGLDWTDDAALIETLYRRAHELHPSDFRINYELGELLRAQRPPRWDESLQYYSAAVALRPDSPTAWVGWGRALGRTDRLEAAERAFREAIRRNPDSPDGYHQFGYYLYRQKRYDEAMTFFERALEVDAHDRTALHRRATVYRAKEEWGAAARAYQDLVEVAPDDKWGLFRWGISANNYGDLRLAIRAYRTATEHYPDFAEAHINLGYILVEVGRLTEAVESIARGHAIGSARSHWIHDSAAWLASVERLVSVDQQLRDEATPVAKRVDKALKTAESCFFQQHRLRLYQWAIERDPELATPDRKLRALAVDAASYSGRLPEGHETAGGSEAVACRALALGWLREDFDALGSPATGSEREVVATVLTDWLERPNLSWIRSEERVARLPEAEQGPLRDFWSAVRRRLAVMEE